MLAERANAEELMDAADLPEETYVRVVHDLARVNTLTLARRPTLSFLQRVLADKRQQPTAEHPDERVDVAAASLRILDIGFGDGDMLRAIAHWGRSRRVALTLVGIDLNPRSLAAAREATDPALAIDYRIGDYHALADETWDVVISSLVAHHMTHDELVTFLRWQETNARRGWFINDLHRHGFAYHGYPLLAAIMRWHPIVRHDGHLSIGRSYRPAEWPPLLAEAGITGAEIERWFPFRLCVARRH